MITPLPGDMFKSGQVLNNTYEIEGILGRGGTGEVYRARNQISGRIVALKALNAEFSGNADYLELMKREEEMRDIIHDAVVRYSDNSRTADGHVFLVMDFVDGPSLNDWLQRGNASPRDLLIVCHRVADGLVATHAHQIVHRDLSPDNIILRKGDPAQAVIIDFGIAKDDSAGARTIVGNDFAGKYEYAAPEQMDGKAEPRSDLYALGASLLATYRGQVPNVGTTPGEVVRRKGKPLDTEGVPEPLKELVDWLTKPDASQRPASAADVVAHLDEVLRPKGRQTVLTKPAPKVARGGFGWAYVLVPLLLIAGATGVFYSGIWRGLVEEAGVVEAPEATGPVVAEPEGVAVATGDSAETEATEPATTESVAAVETPDTQIETAAVEPAIADLPVAAVDDLLGKLANCGPLELIGAGSVFAPGAPIAIVGDVAVAADPDRIRAALQAVAAGRPVQVKASVLTPEICRILELLPPAGTGQMSISLSQGIGGQPNFSGVFAVGDNPVAEVLLPETLAGEHVWAILIDNKNAHNVLPNVNFQETSVGQLGKSEAGVRTIRLLFSQDQAKKAILFIYNVAPADVGKKMLIVIVSAGPLFVGPRPQTESAESMALALEKAFAEPDFRLTAVATRTLDLRN